MNNVSQTNVSILECISETEEPDIAQALQNILREAYKKVGDTDATYGCGVSYLLDTKSRIQHYKYLGRWDKVALHYDLELSHSPQNSSAQLVNALKNCGLYFSSFSLSSEHEESMYEAAWRLGNWDLTENNGIFENKNILFNKYEKYHYIALKSFHEKDTLTMNDAITQARYNVIQSLSYTHLESRKQLYMALTHLQSLREIENFHEAENNMTLSNLIETWNKSNTLKINEFVYMEPIIAQRITILNKVLPTTDNEILKLSFANMLLTLANEARIEGHYFVAQRAINNLTHIENLTSDIKCRTMIEQAKLEWEGDKKTGQLLLRRLFRESVNMSSVCHAAALKLYGSWMLETRSENPQTIISDYFIKSLDILKTTHQEEIRSACEVHHTLARYADSQYQQLSAYVHSPVFQNKIRSIEKFLNMAEQIENQSGERCDDERRAVAIYRKQSAIDKTEVDNTLKEKDSYLILATRHYLQVLEKCDMYNLTMFRMFSLYLYNKNVNEVCTIFKQYADKIASYKYIPVLPQIVPHISNNQQELFDKQINHIIERCAVEHPYHTLPFIIALADSYKDRNYDKKCRGDINDMRVTAARNLVTRLRKDKSIGKIVKNMEILSSALISFAYLPAEKCTKCKNSIMIPSSEKIKNLKNLNNVLVPTVHLDVRKNKNYTNIIGVSHYVHTFSFVGGINAPKKIQCVGTDGKARTQLIKAKDDLRQDAVMQQVFTIMNTLLIKDKQTSELLIRTYKVIPLSQRSGIIEWCENAEPLGDYLNYAHEHYHPTDWTPAYCRRQMRQISNTKSALADIKLNIYNEIVKNLRPVLQMFFISHFPQPAIWFERRRAYMHSVATSSIVGYVLGIGDRHVQNILLDNCTAEVIHIDFGIAFEQGRVLPTPETVPFRLTRDIEAGMGICGIEGVFRRTCEKTVQALRQNSETIITILEVLLYDPLYAWTITPAEAHSRQKDEESYDNLNFLDTETQPTTNITAERTLLRLKQKLQGTESGGASSVEGQVEQLIQLARDPVNLSRLYYGWQPYL